MPKPSAPKTVETLKHHEDKRRNIPTAEYHPPVKAKFEERLCLH
jgi:hypothetical protein